MLRLLTLALLVSAPLLTAAPAYAAGGDLLWQDQFNPAGGQDVARAVAAAKGRVVAVGSAQNDKGSNNFVVRTYAAKTGTLLWQDLVDVPGRDAAATAVVLQDDRVIAAGTGTDATGSKRLLLRAYNAKTGKLAWEDRPLLATFNGLAIAGSRVVVTGTTLAPTENSGPALIVRAYVAKSGVLDWQDQHFLPSGYGFDGAARGVATHGQRVFVAGTVRTPTGDSSCLVRAYIVGNGSLGWESLHPSSCRATAIATDGKRVIVAAVGSVALDDFLAQSYDAETGQFLWEDRTFVSTGFDNEAIAVDIERRLAFVAGWVRWVPGSQNQEALLVRAYETDSDTAIVRWEDQFPGPNPLVDRCLCHASDLVAEKGKVFVVGRAAFALGHGPDTWLVRAYDADGGVLWSDDFAPVSGIAPNPFAVQGALAVAADGGKVFVAGSGINASGNAAFVLRAYDAK